MRTTLDIEDVVLSASRARAAAQGISIGKALSQLAKIGLQKENMMPSAANADGQRAVFPQLPLVPNHVITDELVEMYRDE
ncbi:MAG: DUF2191 domain-containing protein [Arcanobacterium sp.]|nr:DUF2191 domain-containing protein [Arcanobacterium sp.]MDY5588835.1 DUF2191 domain-containing protein [Arcanobacterium sp.]